MKKMIVILSICLALLVGVCVVMELQLGSRTYQVQFQALGTSVNVQNVKAGKLPQPFDAPQSGPVITGWKDAQGQSVDPFALPVQSDLCYEAVVQLLSSDHIPYLFADAQGQIHPDGLLSCDDLSLALNALAAPGTQAYFPKLPTGDVPVTCTELTELLSQFFDAASVNAAFPGETTIARSAFAKGMNQLLGRGREQAFTLAQSHTVPTDLTPQSQNAADLLEACADHTPAETGTDWQELLLCATHAPGFVNVDGELYYVDENRQLLRDADVGTLHFGPDGRYTSGDAELDELVTDILRQLISQNPDAEPMELLRAVFDYCHQNHTYRRIFEGNPEYGSHGWEIGLAKDMLQTKKGNCYSFSAIFWALSRNLGYETRAISGVCLSDRQPHSWCMIEMDGKDYIFDPQWQYDYTEREIFDKDMFKLPADDIYFWGYSWDE